MTLAFGMGFAPVAQSQPTGRQTTPDGKQVLVNRAEGGLQWAISYSPNEGTITGNVFDPSGGDPSYIWCRRIGDDGSFDPAAIAIDWQCEGANACTMSPCDSSGWSNLGVVELGGFFFLPARDPFVTLQRPGAYCDPLILGFVEEFAGNPSWEVDTSICPYASMTQNTRTPIEAGEDVFVRFWNWPLDDPAGGTFHFTLMLGDEVIYSETASIPKQSGLLGPLDDENNPAAICVRPDNPVPAGTPISWNVQLREAPGAEEAQVAVVDGIPDLAGPLHRTPGVVHMIEVSVGSNCEGEPLGRRLVAPDAWTHVSPGLPVLPLP
ncbi:MAG: hypothetical protein P8R42_15635 [Candidatus Binatia bacterium]|nr:hypothetical protein [Candidatus Binatia bacterium]